MAESRRILIWVGPGTPAEVRSWAADLVELATEHFETAKPPQLLLGVVAQLSACIEVGLAILGRTAPRTVEGGARQRSPVILFPFAMAELWSEAIAGDKNGRTVQSAAWDCLRQLAEAGAVEGLDHESNREQRFPDAHAALASALRLEWDDIVDLAGVDSGKRETRDLHRWPEKANVVRPARGADMKDRVAEMVRHLQSGDPKTNDDRLVDIRRDAVQDALQLEALLTALHLEDTTRE